MAAEHHPRSAGRVVAMGFFRRKRDEQPLDLDERSPTTGLKHKDLLVLHQLMQAGADLKQPRHTVHYLYFTSPDAATAASHEAEARGFEVEVRDPLPDYPGQWSLVCGQHGVVVDPPTVRDHGDLFDALAERHCGEYDGWEASV
jgi:hypothetical protein